MENLEKMNLLGYFTYIEGMNEHGQFIFEVHDQERYINITEYKVVKSAKEDFVLFRLLDTIYKPTNIFYITGKKEGYEVYSNSNYDVVTNIFASDFRTHLDATGILNKCMHCRRKF